MSKKNPAVDYQFHVLHEEVAESDLFEDETHESVANTLVKLIDGSDKGITVGLEGSWGSGKSTVIHLLQKKLKIDKKNKTLFFIFDAWAHDGDPLRKIFLESLIEAIDQNGDDAGLENLKSKVSARTKTVKVSTQKTVSKLGKIISLSALFVPVGAALLSALDYKNGGFQSWLFILSFICASAPLITIIWWAIFAEKGSGKWDILESEATENYTQDITEDGERTSIEFERFFSEIMGMTVGQDKKFKRCVIVVDNLDRVDPDYAHNIWSTLQTFFQHRSQKENSDFSSWKNNLWFIVPFDRAGLHRLWHSDDENQNAPKPVAQSFIEKCFQVIAEVPSPVMSAWVRYFNQCVEKALVGWPKDRVEEFSSSYIHCMSKLDSSPTPRQIHAVINKAGLIALQCGDRVSAEAVCLYAIYKQQKTESDFRRGLLLDGVPDNLPHKIPLEKLKAELAGLLFNVPPHRGVQLLLTPEIVSAIRTGDGTKIVELEAAHGAAFDIVWQASQLEWRVSPNHDDDYKINATKAIFEAFSNKTNKIRRDIDALIQAWMDSFYNWDFKTKSFLNSMEQLLSLTDTPSQFLKDLNTQFQAKLDKIVGQFDDVNPSKEELTHVCEVELFLRNNECQLKTKAYAKLDALSWSQWLQRAEEEGWLLPSVLPTKGAITELFSIVNFTSTTLDKKSLSLLKITFELAPSSVEWNEVIDPMIQWAKMSNRETDCEIFYSLMLTMFSSGNAQIKEKIKECVENSQFWVRGTASKVGNNLSLPLLAAIFCESLQDNPVVGDEVKKFWSAENSEDIQGEIIATLCRTNSLGQIWVLAVDGRNKLAKQLIFNKADERLFCQVDGVHNLDELSEFSDEELSRVTLKLCSHGAVELYKERMNGNPIGFGRVMKILSVHGDDAAKNFVKQTIATLTEEVWLEALQEKNALLECLTEKNRKFSAAFQKHICTLVKGEISEGHDESIWSNWDYLSAYLMDMDSMILPEITRAYFSTSKDCLSDDGFACLEKHIASHVEKVQPIEYECRLIEWITEGAISRALWLVNQKLQPNTDRLETLVDLVSEKMRDHDSIDGFDVINEKLNLGIDVDRSGNDENKEAAAE